MAFRKPRNHLMLHDEESVKLFNKYLELESQLRDLDFAINSYEKKITQGSDLKITITHLLQKKNTSTKNFSFSILSKMKQRKKNV